MIRKAILKDVNSIEDTYNEHFQYELNHTAFTVFKKGVYPTKDDAERAIYAGALVVLPHRYPHSFGLQPCLS